MPRKSGRRNGNGAVAGRRAVSVLGVPLDLGAGRRGTDMGPSAVRIAGLHAEIRRLGLDRGRFGTPGWSPFSTWVPRGGRVVIKPNFVRHYHEGGGSLDVVVTHPAVLRPLVDYALLAVGEEGSVVIADAPHRVE